ncbi:hypothetical protein ACN9ML_00100 [Dyadobacter endophyticus]
MKIWICEPDLIDRRESKKVHIDERPVRLEMLNTTSIRLSAFLKM